MSDYKDLDELIEDFKANLVVLIDRVAENERQAVIARIKTALNPSESPKVELVQSSIPIEPQIDTLENTNPPAKLSKAPGCGFCRRRGSPCVRHGGEPTQYLPKAKKIEAKLQRQSEEKPKLRFCKRMGCGKAILDRPLSDYCSDECIKLKNSNEPLHECRYCTKMIPLSQEYCSGGCQADDMFNKTKTTGKTYDEYLADAGKKRPSKIEI